jgi:hypothetical protein
MFRVFNPKAYSQSFNRSNQLKLLLKVTSQLSVQAQKSSPVVEPLLRSPRGERVDPLVILASRRWGPTYVYSLLYTTHWAPGRLLLEVLQL